MLLYKSVSLSLTLSLSLSRNTTQKTKVRIESVLAVRHRQRTDGSKNSSRRRADDAERPLTGRTVLERTRRHIDRPII